jgi:hypothetical protein
MTPSIIARKASNWVDRGEPATPRLMRVLQHLLDRDPERDRSWLDQHARLIEAMVAADATEAQISAYLRSLGRELALTEESLRHARLAATALWSLAKAAQVRDFAERVLQGDVPANVPTPDTLSHWLAQRLLSPDELAAWKREMEQPRPDST